MSDEIKDIEKDLMLGLEGVKNENENDGSKTSSLVSGDFIQDDVLNFVLGYKNKFIVGILAKGVGEKAHLMLNDLYKVSDSERALYKIVIQDFIRENFPEWEDKISKLSNAAIAGLAILEIGRFHEAKILISVEMKNQMKDNSKEVA